SGAEKLAKPAQTIVYNFTVPAEIITIDQSAAAHVLGRGPIAHRRGNTTQEDLSPENVAAKVEQGFTTRLVEELTKTSIPTLPPPPHPPPPLPIPRQTHPPSRATSPPSPKATKLRE